MYHKPPESFIGQGRYGADAVQKAAIEEQMQNARENPLAAAAAAAAVSGAPPPQANAENLLDIDFDGAAPASAQKDPSGGMSGLDGLAGTPQRVNSPSVPMATGNSMMPPASTSNGGMDDLMGLGGFGAASAQQNGMSHQDILGGFAAMDVAAQSQPPPAGEQLADGGGGKKKGNEDLLGLF